MADVTTNALRGIMKTLTDVVVPAIPEDDPLALQELKMVVRYLGFCRDRVDHLYARARYELTFYSGLADKCAAALGTSDAAAKRELADLTARARGLLSEPGVAIAAIRALAQDLMTRISTLLGELKDAAVLASVERIVVLGSAEITAFDRSWYLPLKLERFPAQLRPLGSYIPMPETRA
jgi:hypothetical protein